MGLPDQKYIAAINALLNELEAQRLGSPWPIISLSFRETDKQEREDALYKLRSLNALRIATMTVPTIEANAGSWQIELMDQYEQVRDDYRAALVGKMELANLRYDKDGGLLHIYGMRINIHGLLRKQLCETVLENEEAMTQNWGHEEIVDEWRARGGDYSSENEKHLRKPYDAARDINELVQIKTNGKATNLFVLNEQTIRVDPKYLK